MFELADVLVGIYKTQNCTKSVTITPRLYSKKEDEQPVNNNEQRVNCSEKQAENNDVRRVDSVENGKSPDEPGNEVYQS